jgi:hypothetical protein
MLFLSENATFICGGTVCKCKSYGSGWMVFMVLGL